MFNIYISIEKSDGYIGERIKSGITRAFYRGASAIILQKVLLLPSNFFWFFELFLKIITLIFTTRKK